MQRNAVSVLRDINSDFWEIKSQLCGRNSQFWEIKLQLRDIESEFGVKKTQLWVIKSEFRDKKKSQYHNIKSEFGEIVTIAWYKYQIQRNEVRIRRWNVILCQCQNLVKKLQWYKVRSQRNKVRIHRFKKNLNFEVWS